LGEEEERNRRGDLWFEMQASMVSGFWDHEVLTNTEAVLERIGTRCLDRAV
jgi:hypothetical protein